MLVIGDVCLGRECLLGLRIEETTKRVLTPFEKNLEVWKQLWRVIERSDIVLQILDARDPLLFRSLDLEKYIQEIGPNKLRILLVNKADFLAEDMRLRIYV